jgi:hypothetical protein
MVTLGDGSIFLISLITLLIAASTLLFAGFNFLKMRDPFMTLNIAPQTIMASGLPRGIDPGIIILSYMNSTSNNMLNDFSIKGTICCKDVKIDISNLLPSHVQLAPGQRPPEVRIEIQKIVEQNGIILDAPYVNVHIFFSCSYNRFAIKKEQLFKFKWDRTLARENQWTIC